MYYCVDDGLEVTEIISDTRDSSINQRYVLNELIASVPQGFKYFHSNKGSFISERQVKYPFSNPKLCTVNASLFWDIWYVQQSKKFCNDQNTIT